MANLVFGLGTVCFAIGLVPMVRARNPPPLFTAVTTAFWIWLFVIADLSLSLLFAAAAAAMSATLWTILAVQAFRRATMDH